MKKIVFALILATICIFVLVACAAAMDTKAGEKTDKVTLVMPLSAEKIIAKTPAGDIILGDVDGDGAVTNADVLMIYRYIYNPALYPLPTICDHTFGEWTEEAHLTCTTDGEITRTCTKCSMVENSTLKGGHAYEALAGSPSQYVCLRCGDTYKDVETFAVTFVDYDGRVLKTETVESGKSATAPAVPMRDGYTFVGWDKSFANVTGDLTVKATYSPIITTPTITVSNATASAGETVTVTVKVVSNPGVAGAKIKLNYDSRLSLTSAVSGEAFAALDYTAPAKLVNGCPFNWDSLDAETKVDGTILTLTFVVSGSASVGDALNISVSYVNGDIYNANLDDVLFETVGGTITVK